MSTLQKTALILPYQDNKVLMQLRDDKSGILYLRSMIILKEHVKNFRSTIIF